ncbi:DUF58 domain-containing protein [Thiolapillus brandeum]|nr:DUF58 domain-containing protein [Thiolapillus brandeum]
MNEARMQELRDHAEALPWSLIDFQRLASCPRVGDAPSVFRGQGMEFEENRTYQPGDELRLLNWRLYARTGEMYTRVLQEERRPRVFLLADRRASMRFGTRRQLKATLAAGIASCHAWQARQQALPLGGMILEQSHRWFDPGVGEVALEHLLEGLNSPCEPLALDAIRISLEEALQLLIQRLPHGCFLLMISDFRDLDPHSAAPLLQQLVQRHSIRAIQVLDPVEQRLPHGGDLLFDDPSATVPIRLPARDQAMRQDYADLFSARQAALTDCLTGCGIPLQVCTTTDSVEDSLDVLRSVNDAG